ncbi:transketolase [Pirellulales bacterium]|nr:transketolase [Pirellulales bacterium]
MDSTNSDFPDLQELAKNIRLHVLQMTSNGGSSHIGSSFSMADMIAVLYGNILRMDPTNPECTDRDRFILSKGHAGAAVYAALAEKGFFDKGWLQTHYQNGSKLSGHISHKGIPGVEMSTGSLGHGLPVATGMAIVAKRRKQQHRIFVLLGDGECDEGSNWEAALFAAHHRLSNLTVLIDYNKLQSLDSIEQTLALEPLADKWHSFGWEVEEVDGHDISSLQNTLSTSSLGQKPRCLICHTVKGKGVSFMENSVLWHYRTARGEEYRAALDELTRAA